MSNHRLIQEYLKSSTDHQQQIKQEIIEQIENQADQQLLQDLLHSLSLCESTRDNQLILELINALINRCSDILENDAIISDLLDQLLKLIQQSTCILSCLQCLLSLLDRNYTLDVVQCRKICVSIFSNIQVQEYQQKIRQNIFIILQRFYQLIDVSYKKEFLLGYVNAIEGEQDPRNLLLIFKFIASLNLGHDEVLKDVRSLMFNVLCQYFPVDFNSDGKEDQDIKLLLKEALINAVYDGESLMLFIMENLKHPDDRNHLVDTLDLLADLIADKRLNFTISPESLKSLINQLDQSYFKFKDSQLDISITFKTLLQIVWDGKFKDIALTFVQDKLEKIKMDKNLDLLSQNFQFLNFSVVNASKTIFDLVIKELMPFLLELGKDVNSTQLVIAMKFTCDLSESENFYSSFGAKQFSEFLSQILLQSQNNEAIVSGLQILKNMLFNSQVKEFNSLLLIPLQKLFDNDIERNVLSISVDILCNEKVIKYVKSQEPIVSEILIQNVAQIKNMVELLKNEYWNNFLTQFLLNCDNSQWPHVSLNFLQELVSQAASQNFQSMMFMKQYVLNQLQGSNQCNSKIISEQECFLGSQVIHYISKDHNDQLAQLEVVNFNIDTYGSQLLMLLAANLNIFDTNQLDVLTNQCLNWIENQRDGVRITALLMCFLQQKGLSYKTKLQSRLSEIAARGDKHQKLSLTLVAKSLIIQAQPFGNELLKSLIQISQNNLNDCFKVLFEQEPWFSKQFGFKSLVFYNQRVFNLVRDYCVEDLPQRISILYSLLISSSSRLLKNSSLLLSQIIKISIKGLSLEQLKFYIEVVLQLVSSNVGELANNYGDLVSIALSILSDCSQLDQKSKKSIIQILMLCIQSDNGNLVKYQRKVIKSLEPLLSDKKRSVRQMAANCKNAWHLL